MHQILCLVPELHIISYHACLSISLIHIHQLNPNTASCNSEQLTPTHCYHWSSTINLLWLFILPVFGFVTFSPSVLKNFTDTSPNLICLITYGHATGVGLSFTERSRLQKAEINIRHCYWTKWYIILKNIKRKLFNQSIASVIKLLGCWSVQETGRGSC